MRRLKIFIRRYSLTGAIVLAIVVISGAAFFIFTQLMETKDKLETKNAEIEQLHTKIAQNNSINELSDEEIQQIKTVVSQLVPENEDTFSILYSLEKLSADSGFVISKYAIDALQSTKDTLALTVEGVGDTDAFLKFINDYSFSGGRLITSEKVSYTSDSSVPARLTLNFYTKKTPSTPKSVTLTEKDIQFLRSIKQKTTVVFKDNVSEDYSVKQNPF